MCMMLYLATRSQITPRESPDLRVETVAAPRDAVRQWFSLPQLSFIGAHTGCSCGFPSVTADVPIEFYPGMLDGNPDREADLRSVVALLALITEQLAQGDEVQLYPVWNGEEAEKPKGTIDLVASALVADQFFFNERYFHRIRSR